MKREVEGTVETYETEVFKESGRHSEGNVFKLRSEV